MFLGAPMAANAGELQSDYFDEATIEETNWENTYGGTPLTLDTGNERLDWNFVDADGDSDAAWDLSPSSSGTGDGDTWTISWDMQFGAWDAETERPWTVLMFLGDGEEMLEIQFKDWGDDGAMQINPRTDLVVGGGEVDGVIGNLAVDTWYHVDIVFNRSGGELVGYSGTQDMADDTIDLWVNGDIGVYGFEIVGLDWTTSDLDLMEFYVKGGDDKVGVGIFDNMVVRDEAYVLPVDMVWRTDETGDWAGADWTTDGGSTWVAPIADNYMVVNSGTATVSTDVSGTAAGSLSIARDAEGGTVEIASAGTLAVTGDVTVATGGALNVDGSLVAGGLNVAVGGTLTLGGGATVMPTVEPEAGDLTVTVSGTLSKDGSGIATLGNGAEFVSLTLEPGAVFNWTLGMSAAQENYIDVWGDVTLQPCEHGATALTINFTPAEGASSNGDAYLIAGDFVIDPDGTGRTREEMLWALRGVMVRKDGVLWWPGTVVGGWSYTGLDLVYDDVLEVDVLALTGLIGDTDANGDEIVDEGDYDELLGQFGGPGDANSADFDGNGIVDIEDFRMLRINLNMPGGAPGFGPETTPTPEPATMSLLALGGLIVLKGRRRK